MFLQPERSGVERQLRLAWDSFGFVPHLHKNRSEFNVRSQMFGSEDGFRLCHGGLAGSGRFLL